MAKTLEQASTATNQVDQRIMEILTEQGGTVRVVRILDLLRNDYPVSTVSAALTKLIANGSVDLTQERLLRMTAA